MEVLVGPTFGIDVSTASAAYLNDRPKDDVSSCLFLKEEVEEGVPAGETRGRSGLGLRFGLPGKSPEESSESSSSIGALGDSEDEEDDEENSVVSSKASEGLATLGSLEDSLPIKRGLSSHYSGKSKSFATLSDVLTGGCSMKDLQKLENPLNKRRRVLIASKWTSRRSSFYSWQNPNSMPLLALNEESEDDGAEKEAQSSSSSSSSTSPSNDKVELPRSKLQNSRLRPTFKSQSCFSLPDLQNQHQ